MEKLTVDLSEKIFIHKDFVEVICSEDLNKKVLLKYLRQLLAVDKVKVVQLSVWNESNVLVCEQRALKEVIKFIGNVGVVQLKYTVEDL
mgnify:FL=1